jgi:biotin operon repressor
MESRHKRAAGEEIRLAALRLAEKGEKALVSRLAKTFGISRQAVHKHIRSLVAEGALTPVGSNRGRRYELPILDSSQATFPMADLEENAVWRSHVAPFMESVPPAVNSLAHYCFTEMVNNVIDHSDGTRLWIKITRTPLYVEMIVDDDGVGIFRKIREAMNLDDDRHTMLELTKGKFTTDPQAHSGMGIFFTSKACDKFNIMSHTIYFGHVRNDRDWLMDDNTTPLPGTMITMTIDLDTAKTMTKLYDEYSTPEHRGFTRVTIPVVVAQYGDENLISRSQAKRVLTRVERFKEVLFDFNNVGIVGQAFADEIFRVFAHNHPDVHLIPVNANPQVQAMIDLALENR